MAGKRRLSDMDLEELSQLQVEPQPERRLGAMSMEDLGNVELPPAGVTRRRVGSGDPHDLTDMSLEELQQVPVQPPADSGGYGEAQGAATGAGKVLRGRVGQNPADLAKRLRDIVGDESTDEQIDQMDSTLAAQGMHPDQRAQSYADGAKQHVTMGYSQRRQQALGQYRDEVNKATAERDNQSTTQQMLASIADVFGAYAGKGASSTSNELAAKRSKRFDERKGAAKEALDAEMAGLDIESGSEDEQASMLADLLRQRGIDVPPGAEKRNPKAFIAVYGKVAGEKAGGGLSPELAYRMGRDERADKRHEEERADDIARHAQERQEDLADRKGTVAGFAKGLEQAINELDASGFDATTMKAGAMGYAPNVAKSPGQQQYEQAKRHFINAQLRRESGANISPGEFASADQQYFPIAGDSPEVVEQKRRNRIQALESIKAEAGPAFTRIPTVTSGPSSKPRVVQQNGHTYTLNPQTGEYE